MSKEQIDSLFGDTSGQAPSQYAQPSPNQDVSGASQISPESKARIDALFDTPASAPKIQQQTKVLPKHTNALKNFGNQYRASTSPSEPAPEWGEAFRQGAQNLLPSAKNEIGSMVSAVTHLPDTLSAFKQLGTGAYSKAMGALGQNQDPKEKANTEKLLDSLIGHYSDIYGGLIHGDTSGLRRAIAKDPASILMDASMLISGGASVAGKAAAQGSKAASIASALGKASQWVDPATAAIKGVGTLAKAPLVVAKGAHGIWSGTGKYALDIAQDAGKTSDPALRETFNKFASGQGANSEYMGRLQSAIRAIKSDKSSEYLAGKSNLANGTIDLNPIEQSIKNERAKLQMGSSVGWKDAKDALDEAEKHLYNLNGYNIEHVDALKQQIWGLKRQFTDSKAQSALDGVYHGIRDTLANPAHGGDAGYATLMEKYQDSLNQLADLQHNLANTKNPSAAMAKALKSAKTSGGRDLLSQIAEKDKHIPYMIAGNAVNPIHPGGLRSVLETGMGVGLGMVNPLAGAAAIAAESPKLAGKLAYGTGAASRYYNKAGIPIQQGMTVAERAQQSALEPEEPFSGESTNQSGNLSPLADRKSPLADRNQNWGNIVDKGFARSQPGYMGPGENGFARFDSEESGKAAARTLVSKKIASGLDTPRKLIKTPEHGWDANAPDSYPQAIASALGIGVDDKIPTDPTSLEKVLQVIHQIEAGAHQHHSAFGGRIERADGGRIDEINHLVNRLMMKHRQAKSMTDKTTETLLNAPDEHIVQALKVAQDAI